MCISSMQLIYSTNGDSEQRRGGRTEWCIDSTFKSSYSGALHGAMAGPYRVRKALLSGFGGQWTEIDETDNSAKLSRS